MDKKEWDDVSSKVAQLEQYKRGYIAGWKKATQQITCFTKEADFEMVKFLTFLTNKEIQNIITRESKK